MTHALEIIGGGDVDDDGVLRAKAEDDDDDDGDHIYIQWRGHGGGHSSAGVGTDRADRIKTRLSLANNLWPAQRIQFRCGGVVAREL